jgi:hypothetical protein
MRDRFDFEGVPFCSRDKKRKFEEALLVEEASQCVLCSPNIFERGGFIAKPDKQETQDRLSKKRLKETIPTILRAQGAADDSYCQPLGQ